MFAVGGMLALGDWPAHQDDPALVRRGKRHIVRIQRAKGNIDLDATEELCLLLNKWCSLIRISFWLCAVRWMLQYNCRGVLCTTLPITACEICHFGRKR